jgi:3-oxosteroid 1-dehydrogenase
LAEWDFTTDVLIVGSGGGALCGALVGRIRGLDVLVVEKTNLIGGSTAMSGGGLWIPNNPLVQEQGAPDSEEDALRYFDAIVGDVGPASSPERREAYVTNAPRMVSFLQEQGVPFRWADGYSDYYPDAPGATVRGRTIEAQPFDINQLGPWAQKLRPGQTAGLGLVGYSTELTLMSYYNRSVRNLMIAARVLARTAGGKLREKALVANGGALVGRLLRLVLERGAEVWTEAPLRELIVEHGAVVGAVVRRGDWERRIAVRRGVVLAAGGFSRNRDMRTRYGGGQAKTADWSMSNPGDTGEVLEMAMKLGAATDLLDEAIWGPMPRMPDGTAPAYPPRQMGAFGRARWRPGSILVDASGRRFANEAMSYMELGQLMFARDREARAVPSWLVFDDAFRRRCLFGVLPGRLPEQWVDDGFVKRASTLEELARQCGIDTAGLEATVKQFNEYARTGVDADFHRGENSYDRFMGDPAHGPNNCLAPLEHAPFYAVANFPADFGTCGGLLTDGQARVLTEAGQPIPGLYATGNITASVTGRHYLGAGSSIGPTCTFGFLAVNDIAERADAPTPVQRA